MPEYTITLDGNQAGTIHERSALMAVRSVMLLKGLREVELAVVRRAGSMYERIFHDALIDNDMDLSVEWVDIQEVSKQ